MIQLAIGGNPYFKLDTRELLRGGNVVHCGYFGGDEIGVASGLNSCS